HARRIARRCDTRRTGEPQAGFGLFDLLDLSILLNGNAQVLVAVTLAFIRNLHQAGDTYPASDPCLGWALLKLGEPVGPDGDIDHIAAPRSEIDEDVVLGRPLAALSRSRLNFNYPPDQLDAIADPIQGGGEVQGIDHRIGGHIANNCALWLWHAR